MVDGLSPEQLKELTARAKAQLRQRMSSLRRALPARAIAERSQRIVSRLLETDLFAAAEGIGLFWPMAKRGEVDLRELDRVCRERSKRVYYPFMQPSEGGYHTGFREVRELDELAERGRGFLEPNPRAAPAQRGELDLILVPALAVSEAGYRLGYGAGFYDATLPDFVPPAQSLAVVFSFQLLAELPVEQHDVPCDLVLSDERLLERRH